MLTSVNHLAVVDGLNIAFTFPGVVNMLVDVSQRAFEAFPDEILRTDWVRPLNFSRVQTILQSLI